MLTRGRPCLQRRSLSTVLDNVAAGPERPLLFLYPRWFSPVRHRPVSSFPITSACLNRIYYCAGRTIPRSFGTSSRRSVNSFAEDAVPSTPLSDRSHDPVPERERQQKKPEGHDEATKQKSHRHAPLPRSRDTTLGESDVWGLSSPGRERHLTNAMSASRPSRSRGRKQSEAIVKKLSLEDRKKLRSRKFLNDQFEEKHHERKSAYDETRRWVWIRELLINMEEKMLSEPPRRGFMHKELLLAEETLALMTGVTETSENIWIVPIHHGCKIHALDSSKSKGHLRRVIVSGSERVVEVVCDRIMEAKRKQMECDPLIEIPLSPVPIIPRRDATEGTEDEPTLVRAEWDFDSPSYTPTRLDKLLECRPDFTTVREFTEHVTDLTLSLPAFKTRKKLGREEPRPPDHPTEVTRQLVSLFEDKEYHSLLSTGALNTALSYLLRHEQLKAVRSIFTQGEHLVTVDTFNILLGAMARRQDLHYFGIYLQHMGRLQIRPNSSTWIAFFNCLVAPEAKAALATYLLMRGHLKTPQAMGQVVRGTVQNTFRKHLESGQSVNSYVQRTETACGNQFNGSLIASMFGVINQLKNFEAAKELFELCMQRGFTLNSHSHHQLLGLWRSNILDPVQYLIRAPPHPLHFTNYLFGRLFLTAYSARYYNICRVAWLYACMSGKVTPDMRQTLIFSLTRNLANKDNARHVSVAHWKFTSGRAIVGIDAHESKYTLNQDLVARLPPEYHNDPLMYLSRGFEPYEKKERTLQQLLAREIIYYDMAVGRKRVPEVPLSIMLDAACKLDAAWEAKPYPLPWVMNNAIHVPVREKESMFSDEF
ncbi:hypothetical protein BO70DRAFT_425260 [Aspergillus heteromorphus CBS 117.55]|uniref:Pentatricopeptide repeat protein n=1 Tax=Aspergillus heteromorphus CBS 117.55 TaxID=1448321 RepID=A0A317X7K2_9EURO|nr:uncharacterized protein BO70DRAFT_425260 [Aspergillus heteromorphus CBS 117.55]PWY92580.1 hypothetical protein BO70DRAFT_425260 [Aspergillus heteromorphus CBS 117.55]